MAGEWVKKKIGELGRVVTGKTPPTSDPTNFDGLYPFITIPDLDGRVAIDNTERTLSQKGADILKSSLLPPGSVMMSCIATVGRCGITTKPSFTNQQINSVIPNALTDARFLYYAFRRLGHELESAGCGGSVYTNVSKSRFAEIEISLPEDITEQRAIAHILGTLDDKIELNRRRNQTLEAMSRALFKDWFVDFGPVRAKMEGREPYLPADLWQLFPDRLDDEGKPEGWAQLTVGNCFNLTMGQSPPGDTYNDSGDGLPFFQGRTDFGFRYPENRKYCSAPKRIANPGDTLVSVRAPVGDINLALEKCCIGRGVAAIRHTSGAQSFTYHAVWSLQGELKKFEHTGTVFGAINKKQFEMLPFIEPSYDLIGLYEKIAGPFDDEIRRKIEESRTLAQLRDTLLPKLISGELRIADAERFLEKLS